MRLLLSLVPALPLSAASVNKSEEYDGLVTGFVDKIKY